MKRSNVVKTQEKQNIGRVMLAPWQTQITSLRSRLFFEQKTHQNVNRVLLGLLERVKANNETEQSLAAPRVARLHVQVALQPREHIVNGQLELRARLVVLLDD